MVVTRRSCLREIRATVVEKKPWVLVHEEDRGHGGLPLEEVKEECPQELRPIIFLHCRYHEDDGGSLKVEGERFAKDREVVKWMRVKELQRVRENVALFAQAPPRLSGSSTES